MYVCMYVCMYVWLVTYTHEKKRQNLSLCVNIYKIPSDSIGDSHFRQIHYNQSKHVTKYNTFQLILVN